MVINFNLLWLLLSMLWQQMLSMLWQQILHYRNNIQPWNWCCCHVWTSYSIIAKLGIGEKYYKTTIFHYWKHHFTQHAFYTGGLPSNAATLWTSQSLVDSYYSGHVAWLDCWPNFSTTNHRCRRVGDGDDQAPPIFPRWGPSTSNNWVPMWKTVFSAAYSIDRNNGVYRHQRQGTVLGNNSALTVLQYTGQNALSPSQVSFIRRSWIPTYMHGVHSSLTNTWLEPCLPFVSVELLLFDSVLW